MSDNASLTQEAYQRAANVMVEMKQAPKAATSWLKYKESLFSPQIGERCLWTMVIPGNGRMYFLGYLSKYSDTLYIRPDETRSYEVNDTLYFAYINKMVFESEMD